MELAAATIGFSALVLNIIPLISTGGSASNIKALSWSHTKTAYISYTGISVPDSDFKIEWGDNFCTYALTQDVCDACENAFKTSIAFVAIALVFNVAGLVLAFMAIKYKSSSTWKTLILAMVSALLTMVSGIICVAVYSSQCNAKIDDKVTETLSYGPSWILMLVVLLLKFLEIAVWFSVSAMGSKIAVTNN